LTAKMWKNKYVKKLMKMHSPPAQCNFCDNHGKTLKSAIVPTVQDYITHMGYVVKSDHMMNSYSISRWTWKLKKKLFFHLLYIINFNRFIILASCSPKLPHWLFRLTMVRDLLQEEITGCRRQAPSISQLF